MHSFLNERLKKKRFWNKTIDLTKIKEGKKDEVQKSVIELMNWLAQRIISRPELVKASLAVVVPAGTPSASANAAEPTTPVSATLPDGANYDTDNEDADVELQTADA